MTVQINKGKDKHMKKEIDIGVHIRNELTEYGVEDSKIA